MLKGHIKKHRDRWCGVVYNNYDKKYNYVYDKNKKICEDKLKKLIKKIEFNAQELSNEFKNRDKLNLTIDEAFDNWLETKPNCNEDTKNDYRSIKKCHLTPVLKIKLKDIDDTIIQKFYNDIIKEKGNKSIVRINRCFGTFMRSLYKKHILNTNYMDFIELPKQEKIKHVHLSDAVFKDILTKLKKYDYQLYMIIYTAGYAGLRLGEVLGLDIKNINLKEKYIKVEQQVTFEKGKGYHITDKLKTESSRRTIPLLNNLTIELNKYIHYHNNYIKKVRMIKSDFALKDNLLFISTKGKCLAQNVVDRAWRKFKESNGINSKIRIHDLRRYFATFLMKNNIPDKISKDILGHSEINMTEYYQNNSLETTKNFISKINMNI